MSSKFLSIIVAALLASTFVKAEPAAAMIISVAEFGALPTSPISPTSPMRLRRMMTMYQGMIHQ